MLIATEPTKNLGSIKFGKPHSFDITLINKSDKPTNINNVSVGCSSCTTAKIDKMNLEPKDTTIMHVTFTPGRAGKHKKYVSISYNTGPLLTVEFTAEVYE